MGWFKWFKERTEKYHTLSTPILWLHIFAHFVWGIGLGVLLGGYLRPFGWGIILSAIIVSIPGTYKIWIEKENPKEI
ncbi:MAG: hypothetical protein AB1414_16715 [bacterium]